MATYSTDKEHPPVVGLSFDHGDLVVTPSGLKFRYYGDNNWVQETNVSAPAETTPVENNTIVFEQTSAEKLTLRVRDAAGVDRYVELTLVTPEEP
jgi:hypothetical protein